MDARSFLESLQERISSEELEGENSRIAFDLHGEKGGQYTLIIHEEGLVIEEGLHDDAPCALRAEFSTFMRIVNKEENVLMAIMMGKLKVKNQMEMLKYAKVLGFM
jgi:putative sterol carrier protein